MDFIPCSANAADSRGHQRARRLVQVKFVALPMDAPAPQRRASFFNLISRVIGRLVAARP
jgi:hypothetical protein